MVVAVWELSVATLPYQIFLHIGIFASEWSAFPTFASRGLLAVLTGVSLQRARGIEGKDKHSHGGARLVLWSAIQGYERRY